MHRHCVTFVHNALLHLRTCACTAYGPRFGDESYADCTTVRYMEG